MAGRSSHHTGWVWGCPGTCYVTSLWSRHSHISTSQMRKWRLEEFGGFLGHTAQFSSVQLLSRVTFHHSMDCSTPGFSVRHQLPELAQTHVHQVSDAIQTSRPLSSPSPPAFSLSQHQGLFQGVSSSHQVAKVTLLKSGKLRWPVQVRIAIETWYGNIITSFTTRIGLKWSMPVNLIFR